MMLCPVNVVLKLNRLVNVSCSFNIRGEYFKARYFNNNNNNNNNSNNNNNNNNNNIDSYIAHFYPQCALHYESRLKIITFLNLKKS